MTTFPTLYKIDNKKKLRYWSIKVEDEFGEPPKIIVEHGIEGGTPIQSVTPILKGKGKNTPFDQAISEAKSKYNNKVNREGYLDQKPDEDHFIPRPMLAKKFTFKSLHSKSGKIILPADAQAKLDGIRCFARVKDGDLRSRQMKPFETLTHIAQEVKLLGERLPFDNSGVYLDGEIYHHQIEFRMIQGICNSIASSKKLTPEKLAVAKQLKYFIYDMLDRNQPEMPYAERYQALRAVFEQCQFQHLVLLETHLVKTADEIKERLNYFVEQNYEGIILRNRHGPYEADKRSQHLQKYKLFIDEEFPIVDFKASNKDYWVDNKGNQYPTVIWICRTQNGKEFSCTIDVSKKEQHEYYLKGKDYIGALLTVKFQEYTPDGIPRFPKGKEIRKFV